MAGMESSFTVPVHVCQPRSSSYSRPETASQSKRGSAESRADSMKGSVGEKDVGVVGCVGCVGAVGAVSAVGASVVAVTVADGVSVADDVSVFFSSACVCEMVGRVIVNDANEAMPSPLIARVAERFLAMLCSSNSAWRYSEHTGCRPFSVIRRAKHCSSSRLISEAGMIEEERRRDRGD